MGYSIVFTCSIVRFCIPEFPIPCVFHSQQPWTMCHLPFTFVGLPCLSPCEPSSRAPPALLPAGRPASPGFPHASLLVVGQAIQSGLTALVQLQDALWRDLPVLKDPVLHTLHRINVDRHLLDQEVRQQMRVGAARLLAGR